MEVLTMRKMEVFFDYSCPYCLTGHEYLVDLLPKYPDVEIIWKPCEAHPRPEEHGLHSDVCIQALFYALDNDVDVWEFHDRMYKAAVKDHVNIEDPGVIANLFTGLPDTADLLETLKSNKYEQSVLDYNDYAYEESDVWVVPAFRMDGKKLDSIGGVGITKAQLDKFLKG